MNFLVSAEDLHLPFKKTPHHTHTYTHATLQPGENSPVIFL